ncbi:MAG: TIGR01777 family oxidoreductase [Verrucomicrobia bacterium]|nr:TIGR01777 family oxidoreductase [Verrucomicrobiota bacterium]
MTILIAGGTGFIGHALCRELSLKGHEVALVSRRPGAGTFTWKEIENEGLPNCDAVIHLAGAPLTGAKWTKGYRELLLSSRVNTTLTLVKAIERSSAPPKVLLNASAVGYYPPDPDRIYTENDLIMNGNFLNQLVRDWESAATLPLHHPTRVSRVRIGAVLGREGGALARLLPIFKLGLGGRLGTGFQPFPWIHLQDLVNAFLFALDHDETPEVINAVAPECITNRQFTRAMGKVLGRPTPFVVPALLLRWWLGDQSDLILHGQFVVPQKLVEMGFRFTYPTIEIALANLLEDIS